MSTKVYVGNLSWGTNEDILRGAFEPYGTVLDAIVLKDRDTGRSRGFGFVTLASPEEANAAINGLDGQELDGKSIKVSIANERLDRGNRPGRY
ncbi:RNA-binding protein [Ktedonosporobacter rubrisoli]|uniref:RNA-binding protein n=1 Tax=Ktedonosporobacter rubrisoli TaxID=2509675 RepID=A0A4V0YZG6_KTERU|nr:RNA-binding protein [Ktedonosporobacter rubrisoli]QBD79651.1 RNA-binding protein [Ktedonosporobacter rubrisoli]